MISAQLPMTNPAMATAVPVNAFSREMTTGMSAQPIGITIDDRPGERHRADQHVQQRRHRGHLAHPGPGVHVVVDGDQRGRAAADRVEQADQLRHRGQRPPSPRERGIGRVDRNRWSTQSSPLGEPDPDKSPPGRSRVGRFPDERRPWPRAPVY